MYLNEILPGKWREDEWPEHIEVSHEASRFKSRRYVPRVNSANKSSANPVDGIWCSHCGWAGVIAQDGTHRDSSVAQRRTRWGGCHDPLRHRLHLGEHLRASVGDG